MNDSPTKPTRSTGILNITVHAISDPDLFTVTVRDGPNFTGSPNVTGSELKRYKKFIISNFDQKMLNTQVKTRVILVKI